MTTLHEGARELVARRLAVHPCRPDRKEPVLVDWGNRATLDPAQVDAWWGPMPDLNIGVATGKPSGVFVLDVDNKNGKDGEADLRKLEEQHGPLPPTVEAITPDGPGRHQYFRVGAHGHIPPSVGVIAPGLDIRGDGSYVIAPPSTHPNGGGYVWSVDGAEEFADAPDWLHKLIGSGPLGKNGTSTNKLRKTPLDWHKILTRPLHEGARDDTLFSIACKLLERGLSYQFTLDQIACVNIARCVPLLEPGEVEKVAKSAVNRHLKNRGVQP